MLENPSDQIIGSFGAVSLSLYQAKSVRKQDIAPMAPLKGPKGVEYATYTPGMPSNQWYITKDCKNPEAAFKLADFMWSEDASVWSRFGEPNVDYTVADTSKSFYHDVMPDMKLALNAILVWGSVQNAHWCENDPKYRAYNSTDVVWNGDPLDTNYITAKAVPLYKGKAPKETVNKILYTSDEQDQLKDITNSLTTYVQEMIAQFITGNKPFSYWDSYTKQLDTIGLKQYLQITQKAYDRMKKAG